MNNTFRRVGEYQISNVCYETYPCKHDIVMKDGVLRTMCGGDMYRMLRSEGVSEPHFNMYAEWVRKQDFPTPEEIQKRKDDERDRLLMEETRKKEAMERQQLTDQFKSSTRLDRLKQATLEQKTKTLASTETQSGHECT